MLSHFSSQRPSLNRLKIVEQLRFIVHHLKEHKERKAVFLQMLLGGYWGNINRNRLRLTKIKIQFAPSCLSSELFLVVKW